MAGRGDIKAGRAYVELFVKNSALVKGLDIAGKKLQAFGGQVGKIGGLMAGMGGAIIAPLTGAINHFADAGDALDKMSARTGIGVTALSELGFAAEQSGSNLAAVEGAVLKMNRRLGRITVGQGSGAQVEAIEELGLSVARLNSMNPEERFLALADAMAGYGDDAAAAGLAQRAFGTGVDAILPLLTQGRDGIAALREEARDLGISVDPESTKAAAELTDGMNRMRRSVKAVVYEVGASLAPAAIHATEVIRGLIKPGIEWVKQNAHIVRTVAAVGLALVGVGTGVAALGGGIAALGVVLSGAATILGTIGAALGVLLSPIGLITSALGAGVLAWARYTDSGHRAVSTLRETLGEIADTARDTFAGIWDAIAAGDLELAGQIAVTGLQLAIVEGFQGLGDAVGGIWGDMIGTLGQQLAAGDLAGMWQTVLTGLQAALAKFAGTVLRTWAWVTKGAAKLIATVHPDSDVAKEYAAGEQERRDVTLRTGRHARHVVQRRIEVTEKQLELDEAQQQFQLTGTGEAAANVARVREEIESLEAELADIDPTYVPIQLEADTSRLDELQQELATTREKLAHLRANLTVENIFDEKPLAEKVTALEAEIAAQGEVTIDTAAAEEQLQALQAHAGYLNAQIADLEAGGSGIIVTVEGLQIDPSRGSANINDVINQAVNDTVDLAPIYVERQAELDARVDEAREQLAASAAGGNDRTAELRKQLEDLKRQASEARQRADEERKKRAEGSKTPGPGEPPPDIAAPDVGKLRNRMSVTFSAAAFAAMGQGGGPQERIAKAVEETLKVHRKEWQEQAKRDQAMLQKLDALGFDFT